MVRVEVAQVQADGRIICRHRAGVFP